MREPLLIPVEPWERNLVLVMTAVALVALLIRWLDRRPTNGQK